MRLGRRVGCRLLRICKVDHLHHLCKHHRRFLRHIRLLPRIGRHPAARNAGLLLRKLFQKRHKVFYVFLHRFSVLRLRLHLEHGNMPYHIELSFSKWPSQTGGPFMI